MLCKGGSLERKWGNHVVFQQSELCTGVEASREFLRDCLVISGCTHILATCPILKYCRDAAFDVAVCMWHSTVSVDTAF